MEQSDKSPTTVASDWERNVFSSELSGASLSSSV